MEHEFAVPSSSGGPSESSNSKLTNDDFRKLMMTPRSSGPAALTLGTPALGSGSVAASPQTPKTHTLSTESSRVT